MAIYLLRHAQSLANAQGIMQGRLDLDLSPLGIKQAKATAQWLKQQDITPDVIYTSPLKRTVQTAQLITENLGGGAAEVRDELIEFDAGKLEGLTYAELAELKPPYFDRPLDKRGDFQDYGGESYEDVQERLKRFQEFFYAAHSPQAEVLLVSHGGALYQLLKLWCSWPAPRHVFLQLGNCSCAKLIPRVVAEERVAFLQWLVSLELFARDLVSVE